MRRLAICLTALMLGFASAAMTAGAKKCSKRHPCPPSPTTTTDTTGTTTDTTGTTTDTTGTTPTGTTETTPTGTTQAPPPSTSSAVAVPSSGLYFGAYVSSNTGYTTDQRETQIGRKFRIVHRYHGWTDKLPEPEEVTWASGGRILYLAWDARDFKSSSHPTWAQIANGSQDAVIDAQAARIKAFGQPLFMDFSQEPEGEINAGGYGSASDFAAAFRHIVERFRASGATNVSWVWSVEGGSGRYSLYTSGLYPGDDVVDWIGWDPYNWYRCNSSSWISFADKVHHFYDWLQANGHANKPLMLSEYGSREGTSGQKGQWFRDELTTLKAGAFPKLKAVVYFDVHPSECDWRIDSSPEALDGFKALAADPLMNP
jgi:hypothetical protein